MLPGLAMGFNSKGVVFTVNTLVPKETLVTGTRKKTNILKIPNLIASKQIVISVVHFIVTI